MSRSLLLVFFTVVLGFQCVADAQLLRKGRFLSPNRFRVANSQCCSQASVPVYSNQQTHSHLPQSTMASLTPVGVSSPGLGQHSILNSGSVIAPSTDHFSSSQYLIHDPVTSSQNYDSVPQTYAVSGGLESQAPSSVEVPSYPSGQDVVPARALSPFSNPSASSSPTMGKEDQPGTIAPLGPEDVAPGLPSRDSGSPLDTSESTLEPGSILDAGTEGKIIQTMQEFESAIK